jgi:hypothetical protein
VAWCKPHSTEADRTRKQAPPLGGVYSPPLRKNLHDTGVLTSQFYAGFPTRQWLNLLANVGAQAVFMMSLPLEQRRSYKTLVQSTTPCESSFSQIPQVRGTSTKPPVSEIQGKSPKLDRIVDIKRTQSEYGLTFRHSKRKKREHYESWGGRGTAVWTTAVPTTRTAAPAPGATRPTARVCGCSTSGAV